MSSKKIKLCDFTTHRVRIKKEKKNIFRNIYPLFWGNKNSLFLIIQTTFSYICHEKKQNMILIADSGSTKTTWWLVDSEHHKIAEFQTLGINPFYQTEIEIYNELNNSLIPHLNTVDVHSVFFYGAGCHFEDKKNIVKSALEPLFKNADIEINNDLLGACRALLLNQKGIACILGTGSNSCYYDGTKIVNNVSPLEIGRAHV